MRSDSPAVVVVGGGYSGTMAAAKLARRGLSSVLIDGSGREGRGTAYSTPEDAHLLNVIAGRMGAWADKPGDFAEAVAAEGFGPNDYVPRRRYGEYLSNILHEARSSGLVTLAASDASGRADRARLVSGASRRIAGRSKSAGAGPG